VDDLNEKYLKPFAVEYICGGVTHLTSVLCHRYDGTATDRCYEPMVHRQELSKKDVWQTPDWLIDGIQQHVTIDLDPCAGANTHIGETNYRLEDGDDGLSQPWFGTVFCNPPFTQKTDWLDKAVTAIDNTELILFVTPDSTDVQSWWHGSIVPHARYVWFSKGRVSYVDPTSDGERESPPFGTAISIFGDPPNTLLHWFDENGWVVTEAERQQ
jgi:phage N-6-adenine-methyltransferase